MTNKYDQGSSKLPPVRLDRWLWAARFYKTRSLAKQAIEGGKIHLNGQRSKPSRSVNIDDEVVVSKGTDKFQLCVLNLSDKRGPARTAKSLYQETQQSIKKRFEAAEIRKVQHRSEYASKGKPDKRQRRKIHQFKHQNDE